jgi:hypothetical protein
LPQSQKLLIFSGVDFGHISTKKALRKHDALAAQAAPDRTHTFDFRTF